MSQGLSNIGPFQLDANGNLIVTSVSGSIATLPRGSVIPFAIVARSSTYTATIFDQIIPVSGSFVLTLPAASARPGQEITIYKTDASALAGINIARSGSDTIGTHGATNVNMYTEGESATFVSDGVSNWIVKSHTTPSIKSTFTIVNPNAPAGFGTLQNATNGTWWREGKNMRILNRFNSGTSVTAVEGRLNIPLGFSADANIQYSIVGHIGVSGVGVLYATSPGGTTYLDFYVAGSSNSPQNANSMVGANADMNLDVLLPINEWGNW